MTVQNAKAAPRGGLRRLLTILVIALLVIFLVLQFIPIGRSNPPVVSEPNWDSPETRDLAQRACFDCHSNETVWPWYSYVAPVSWPVVRDVVEGRQVLNFSDWGNVRGEAREAGEMAEVLQEGEMPPAPYVNMHPDANLTSAERQQLLDGLRATLRQSVSTTSAESGEDDDD
jgi:hypothetical protein